MKLLWWQKTPMKSVEGLRLRGMVLTFDPDSAQKLLSQFCVITMDTLCFACGQKFGRHMGVACPPPKEPREMVDPNST